MSSIPRQIKSSVGKVSALASGATARLRIAAGRPARFSGAFPSREVALASLSAEARGAYDRDDVAEVSYDAMTRVAPWDYPVLYWMNRCLAESGSQRLSLLDAGGHLGTKYTAFGDHLPLSQVDWHLWDLPAILRAARNWQGQGKIPAAINFVDDPAASGPVDLLLASGLLQYLDRPLAELIGEMAAPPRWILLNKVAVSDAGTVVTLEQIGPAQVPYQIRDADQWAHELEALGYTLRDSWTIPSLSHRIATHPWLPASQSRGYMLERTLPADPS